MSEIRLSAETREERAALRLARWRAHAAFDRLWKTRNMWRREAYLLLAQYMGVSNERAHIGQFTVAQCEELVAILSPARPGYTRNLNHAMEQNVTL